MRFKNRVSSWLAALVVFIYEYSGFKFVASKFVGKKPNQENFKEPPSGVIWLISIYIAAYGLAHQNFLSSQGDNREAKYSLYPREEETECKSKEHEIRIAWGYAPVKPRLLIPRSVYQSIFSEYVPAFDRSNELVLREIYKAQDILDEDTKLAETGTNSIDGRELYISNLSVIKAFSLHGMKADELREHCRIFTRENGSLDPILEEDYWRIYNCTMEVVCRACKEGEDPSPRQSPNKSD